MSTSTRKRFLVLQWWFVVAVRRKKQSRFNCSSDGRPCLAGAGSHCWNSLTVFMLNLMTSECCYCSDSFGYFCTRLAQCLLVQVRELSAFGFTSTRRSLGTLSLTEVCHCLDRRQSESVSFQSALLNRWLSLIVRVALTLSFVCFRDLNQSHLQSAKKRLTRTG